jgi:hypothetical protein
MKPTQPHQPNISRPVVNDVAGPAPRPQVNPAQFNPSIVDHIPVQTPAAAAAAPGEDDELDKLLRDVGHELKQAERHIVKKRFSLFGGKLKASPKTQPPATTAQAGPALAQPYRPPAAPAAKTSSAPVLVVFITIIVTGGLIAAAIYTYNK